MTESTYYYMFWDSFYSSFGSALGFGAAMTIVPLIILLFLAVIGIVMKAFK